jgi:FtsZ-interacting cell division protein ZipA
MSDLFLMLVVLGCFIIAAVVLFNWWQERKYKNRISQDFKPSKRDVLIDDYKINTDIALDDNLGLGPVTKREPTHGARPEAFAKYEKELSSKQEALDEASAPSTQQDFIVVDPLISQEDTDETKPQVDISLATSEPVAEDLVTNEEISIELPAQLNPQIDLVAVLSIPAPINLARILDLNKEFKTLSEHMFVFGLTPEHDWLEINSAQSDAKFKQLAYGLQLADRSGAVAKTVLNRYQHMVESIGLDVDAEVLWQNSEEPFAQATVLDEFCIQVDQTVGFHLYANDSATFHATKLRGLMEAQGLSLGSDGKFHYYNVDAPERLEFSVQNLEDNPFNPTMLKSAVMRGVSFQLDIATVKNSIEIFNNMVIIAKSMAKSLDASIIDDHQRVLGDIHLEKIRQQLRMINAQMMAKDIVPGSAHALRLFS